MSILSSIRSNPISTPERLSNLRSAWVRISREGEGRAVDRIGQKTAGVLAGLDANGFPVLHREPLAQAENNYLSSWKMK
jgi:hypothetical protein